MMSLTTACSTFCCSVVLVRYSAAQNVEKKTRGKIGNSAFSVYRSWNCSKLGYARVVIVVDPYIVDSASEEL